jgi:ABC-type branched-subunit amino acid transport system permease subunit
MKTMIRKSINSGVVFSIVMIFLALIGFTSVLTALVGSLLGYSSISKIQPVSHFVVLQILLGIWCGYASSKKNQTTGLGHAAISGLSSGLAAGLLFGILVYIIGIINAGGNDIRVYLTELSDVYVRYLAFNLSPLAGALLNVGIFSASSTAGAILHVVLTRLHWNEIIQKQAIQFSQSVVHHPKVESFLQSKTSRWTVLGVILLAAFFLPRQWGSYWNYTIGTVGIYILLGIGLNIIVGLSGQLVLGYVAFYAIGAYTFGLLTSPLPHNIQMNFWLALLIAILVAALTGILLGLPILNLRGDYLAIVTLGFGEIIRILLKSDLFSSFTGGPSGIRNIAQPSLFGINLSSDVNFMYLIIIAVAIGMFIAYRIQYSRTGRSWMAIRDDETVAKATGINTFRYKLLALAIGAAFAGLGGAIFASRGQFTGPEDHVMMVSINVLCLVIVGGMGSLPGIILGSFVLKGLPEILRGVENYRLLAFGALLVIMMIMRPEGLWPTQRPSLENKFAVEKEPQPAVEAGGKHE